MVESEWTIPLNASLSERLTALIPEVEGAQAVRELGVVVDLRVVARIALMRGLADLEAHGYTRDAQAASRARLPENSVGPKAASAEAKSTEAATDTSDMVRDESGMIEIPAGWSAWVGNSVPESHEGVHAYYVGCGWQRWTGKAGTETMHFYWSPDESLHAVPVYDIPDMRGKMVLNQATPYGPGHIVPHGWAGGV